MPASNKLAEPGDAIRLDDEPAVKKLLTQTVYSLWDVVNNLTRLRPSTRERYRVSIFGSARTEPGSFVYEEVKRLAQQLATLDIDVITGGGPGLMQAANEGASTATKTHGQGSIGIRIQLEFEQTTNPFVHQEFVHRTFFSRLHHFVLMSDAFVVVPGGIGTALEALMIWQLLQVRKLNDTPLIMVGAMWSELIEWTKKYMLRPDFPLISPADASIPTCVTTVEETVVLLQKHYAAWTKLNAKQ
jgi:uncharacterized protein (TIGR00730 family)